MVKQVLRAASGWIELGMPDDALEELSNLEPEQRESAAARELALTALMAKGEWKAGADVAIALCQTHVDHADYFLSAAFCLHEIGATSEARKWLLKGPESMDQLPVYHYNMACYLWILGEKPSARGHLEQAIEMDSSFLESAKEDRDLAGMKF